MTVRYIPATPAGTLLFDLEAKTRQEAIDKLLRAAAHMPYGDWPAFQARGYEIEELEDA